jgi:hypothetical protein
MHKKTNMPSRRSPKKPPADYKETQQRIQGIRARQQPVTAAPKKKTKKKWRKEKKPHQHGCHLERSKTSRDSQRRWSESCLFVERREKGKEETRSAAKKEDEAKVQGLNLPPLTPFRASLG